MEINTLYCTFKTEKIKIIAEIYAIGCWSLGVGKCYPTYKLSDIQYLNFVDLTNANTIPEYIFLNKMVLFPNPVKDVLNIQFNKSINNPLSIEIIKLDGKVVYKNVFETSTRSHQVDLSNLPRGLYFYRLSDRETSETIKFLKN